MTHWKGIIIHHSASQDASAEEIRRWHIKRGFKDIGYHFVIRKDGNLELGRPLSQIGLFKAHCRGYNKEYIGIVLTGNFEEYPPSDEQYKTLKTVLQVLTAAFQIDPFEIFLHKDLANTLCPGKYFSMEKTADAY